MTFYADTSLLVALFAPDPLAERAAARMERLPPRIVVTDFAQAEFAAVLGAELRRGDVSRERAAIILDAFDGWIAARADAEPVTSADIALATRRLRRLDLTLRTPDALHLAVAARPGVPVATFDLGTETAARRRGIAITAA